MTKEGRKPIRNIADESSATASALVPEGSAAISSIVRTGWLNTNFEREVVSR